MEDVAKPQYLTHDDKGPKLKRNVPEKLKSLAGRPSWTKRLTGLSMAEIRKQANIFAAWTDAEIAKLKRQREQGAFVRGSSDADADHTLVLTDLEVRQVAISFFFAKDKGNVEHASYFADHGAPEFPDILSDAGHDYAEAIRQAAGDPSYADRTALQTLIDQGYLPASALPKDRKSGTPDGLRTRRWFQYLCRLIERAEVELAHRRLEALQSGHVPTAVDELFRLPQGQVAIPVSPVSDTSRKTVHDLVVAFSEKKEVEVGKSRQSQFQVALRALREELGPTFSLLEITRRHCSDLAALFVRVPAYVGQQRYQGLKLQEAADAYEKEHGEAANRYDEAVKHVAVLRRILDHAVTEEWIEKNPSVNVQVVRPLRKEKKFETKQQTYQPFDLEDLTRLFNAPLFITKTSHPLTKNRPHRAPMPHEFWAPLLALWTGARSNEILQLERGDVRFTETVPYLAITDEDEVEYDPDTFQKRLKTEHAVRDIPIHPVLFKIGFLEWVERQPKGRLFPDAKQRPGGKPSDIYSQRFQRFSAKCGVWKHRRKVFHSFRNTFNDALRDGGVPVEIRNAINGWQAQHMMDNQYGKGHKVNKIYEEIKKVDYPGLDLSHLYPNASKGS